VVRVVLELQVYRGLHTGGFEGLLGLGRIRLAGTVAIGFLQGVVVAGQAMAKRLCGQRVPLTF